MTPQGYTPKTLTFDGEGRKKLMAGITAISKAVKSTLGPRGKTVLLESAVHTGGLTVTKDGVTVASAIRLDDPIEDLAILMMREAAMKTANSAGDGTTTAIVLTEAIVKAGESVLAKENNLTEVIKHINALSKFVIKSLTKKSKKITNKLLLDVATISANNDNEIGKIIAEAYNEVGVNGVVTVERSQNSETFSEVTTGIKIAGGYTSNLFINNQKKDECVLEDVKILVCDQEINNILQIENVLKPIINNGDKLLIIAPCAPNVINTMAANVQRNGLKFCNIAPPNFGYKQHELMQDIALAVGAKYFSEKTGDDLSLMRAEDLGTADKIIVASADTIILKENNQTEELTNRIKELKVQQDNTVHKAERSFIDERVASLAGSIGCIFVGGHSEIEQKEKYDRVDDSVCAVRSALEEGIIPGGGLALFRVFQELTNKDWLRKYNKSKSKNDIDYNAALMILRIAMKVPMKQILVNAGIDDKKVIETIYSKPTNYGYDVKNDKYGNMFSMGVIDPLKVTKHAFINAVSVATTILSTNAIVTNVRAK